MITQWDIISSIRPKDNALVYALLIDGTEHDARLIAKKLQGYVRPAQPAMAPYVYRFPLPDDLDEDTLEKIRVAVREGIEQAKKVNEFVPGGALGNPLFNAGTDKEDKEFPTFITLDPSESFFHSAAPSRMPPPPPPPVNQFEQKEIDLSAPEEEIPQIAKTLEEIDNAGYRSDPVGEPTPPAKPEEPAADTSVSLEQTAEKSATSSDAPVLPETEPENTKQEHPLPAETETPAEEMLTSVESDEAWSDEPPASAQEPQADAKDHSLHLEVQAVAAEELPEGLNPVAPAAATDKSAAPAPDSELPISDRDMLIKDMEGTMLGQSLDDIFLAETKYDMFVDLEQLTPSKNAAGKDASAPQKPAAPAGYTTGQTAPAAPLDRPLPDAEGTDGNAFNIFDQKIKDQTSFIDLDDIKGITERITQKDLSFMKHAQVPAADKQPKAKLSKAKEQKPLPQEDPALDKTRAYMPLPSSFGRINDDDQEVMDPFEQMLAASRQEPPKTDHAETAAPSPAQPRKAAAQTLPPSPVLPQQPPETDTPTPQQEPEVSAPQTQVNDTVQHEEAAAADTLPHSEHSAEEPPAEPPATQEQTQRTPIPVPPAMPTTEKNMPENQGDKKPILRIKRKAQPEQNAVPQPPKPVPPTPQPAVPPVPQQPHAPAAQQPAAPQEEKHNTTILRRRRPSGTFLEKTRTIDHSIELPLSELKKHNWPLEVPLVPTYTLENMTISVNRFAHATAISVIDNPGKLYNPLVLHGASGTGKTHFLHAIGYALSNKYGQENIFITNGVRLSRGIQRYVMEGNMDKFENFTNSVKALLIDDIHLIAINEQNRAHLSKLLNDFLKQQKQIVITSKYPPESLAKLEELLNFRLDSGWISDLKPATGTARTRIIQKMLNDNGIDITNEDISRFFGHPNMSLGTVSRAIRRVRVLEKLIFPNESQEKRSATAIFDQLLATEGDDKNSLIAQKYPNEVTSAPVEGKGEWGRIGFFYPQNHSNMMNWLVFALQQRAKELGISGGPELAVRSSYSTENIISSAFKIANLCDNKKLKGAVILGPEVTACDPSVRENFYDILTHMLEIMLIRCGVINYEDVSSPSTYVKILSELLR